MFLIKRGYTERGFAVDSLIALQKENAHEKVPKHGLYRGIGRDRIRG